MNRTNFILDATVTRHDERIVLKDQKTNHMSLGTQHHPPTMHLSFNFSGQISETEQSVLQSNVISTHIIVIGIAEVN